MTRAPLCAKCHHLKWCTCDGYQPPATKTKEDR